MPSGRSGEFRNAAIRVLQEAGKAMTATEIAKIARDKGYLVTDGLTPGNTLNAILTAEIRNKGAVSCFVKEGRGLFRLARPLTLASARRSS